MPWVSTGNALVGVRVFFVVPSIWGIGRRRGVEQADLWEFASAKLDSRTGGLPTPLRVAMG